MNHLFGNQNLFDPVDEAFPVFFVDHNNRETTDLLCLDEGERFRQFVERSKSARHYNKSLRVLYEHDFTDEEIIKGYQLVLVDVDVALLLEDRKSTRLNSSH